MITLPFITKDLFFSKKLDYVDDYIIVCIDIEPLNEFDNMYFNDKYLNVTTYFEDEDCYNLYGLETFNIFGDCEMNDHQFHEYLLKLYDCVEYCRKTMNKHTFIILNTSQCQYEFYFDDYELENVINIRRLYGHVYDGLRVIPNSTTAQMLSDITNCYTKDNIIDVFHKWLNP